MGFSAYALTGENNPSKISSEVIIDGCDQSATTTDCAMLAELYSPAPEPVSTELEEVEWREYRNDGLGFSFQYPTKSTLPLEDRSVNGDAGWSFGISIPLPTGASISGHANTSDYSAGKGGVYVGTEGYVKRDGGYSIVNRGEAADIIFIPDEIIELQSGSQAIVIYQKNFDPSADYPEPTIRAMINLRGDMFTGIGFLIYDSSANPENIRLFKQIISSIEVY